MIDVMQAINATERRVGTRDLEQGRARTVTISRVYNGEVEDVWDAITNPERIPRWFLPVTGDLREGGRYQLEGNAGGTIERCDPPKSFAATWEFAGGMSWIEVRLTPQPQGRTHLELEHVALEDDHWKQYGPGAVGIGWELGLLGLSLHLSSGAQVDGDEYQAWSMSEEGKRFVTLSSERWGDADVAGGADEAQARQAAARTTAFYTGAAEGDASSS